jgi:hypothetical protein
VAEQVAVVAGDLHDERLGGERPVAQQVGDVPAAVRGEGSE